jgi:hypothetical protein
VVGLLEMLRTGFFTYPFFKLNESQDFYKNLTDKYVLFYKDFSQKLFPNAFNKVSLQLTPIKGLSYRNY